MNAPPIVARALRSLVVVGVVASAAGCRPAPAPVDPPLAVKPAPCGKRVLLIGDDVPHGYSTLALALSAAGFDVTTTLTTASDFRGAPGLGSEGGVDAIVLLSGGLRTPPVDMPVEGQRAIAEFVGRGGGLVLSEWAAFHRAASPEPRWQQLDALVLLNRQSSRSGRATFTVDPAFASHPVWAGLPAEFTFSATMNVGTIKAAPGVAAIAHGPDLSDAVAIRDAAGGAGRVVHLAHAGNHVVHGWANVNLQRLVTNAVGWVGVCRDGGKP